MQYLCADSTHAILNHLMLFLGIISATTDSSNTSIDRDSSVPENVNVHTNNRAIAGLQQSFYKNVLPGRNEVTNIVDHDVIANLTDAQQETEDVDVNSDVFNVEEEPTTMPSARRVVTDDTTLIFADDQVNQYPIVHAPISETNPTEAQDIGYQEIPNSAFKTTFIRPPVDQPSLINGQPSLESDG